MTVTEFVSFKLKQKLSEEQLRQNEPWQNCLDVLHRQPGCKDLKWGSLIEDAETVVLLVGTRCLLIWSSNHSYLGITA